MACVEIFLTSCLPSLMLLTLFPVCRLGEQARSGAYIVTISNLWVAWMPETTIYIVHMSVDASTTWLLNLPSLLGSFLETLSVI